MPAEHLDDTSWNKNGNIFTAIAKRSITDELRNICRCIRFSKFGFWYVLQLRSSLSQCLVFDTGDVGRVELELQRKTKIQMSVTREGFVVY